MRVVLWRRRRESEAAGTGYQQYLFSLRRLGIGSGVDQPVCVPDPRLAHRHAVIERRWGRLRIRAWTSEPVLVNGTPRLRARLRPGDRIDLGSAILTVKAIRRDGVLVLRLKSTRPEDGATWHRDTPLTIEQTGLKRSRLVLRTVAVMTVLVVALPLLASLDTPLRDSLRAAPAPLTDSSWQPGPLQHAHEAIGRDCNSCHREGFHRVPNAACVTCHGNTQHHVGSAPAARQLFALKRCAECHLEHATPSRLVDRDSALCTSCHASLREELPGTSLQDASDFGRHHPEFALALWVPPQAGSRGDWREQVRTVPPPARPNEQSHLKFSHAVHLRPAGVKSPTGERVLACHDCHRSDTDGRYMEPIRMESHCIECHELRFDEHDPGSQVPHGDIDKVLDALQSHFSRRFLELQATGPAARRRPGEPAGMISEANRRQALAWATRETQQTATELIERRVCVQCHEVTVTPGAAGAARWHIEPIAFVARWMPRARFDHTRHANVECTDCHHGARESKSAHDVLMPQLSDCRRCHGGSADRRRVASECVLCHQFHQPGRGPYAANVRESADGGR